MKRLVLVLSFFLLTLPSLASAQDVDKTSFSDVYKKYNELIKAGDFENALEYAELSYELGKKQFDAKTEEMGALSFNLGLVNSRNYHDSAAREYLTEALRIMEANHGENAIQLLDVYMELGSLNAGTFKNGMAKSAFGKALSIARDEYGDSSPIILDLEIEIANAYLSYNARESQRHFKEAYELGKIIYPDDDYRTGYAAFSIGKIEVARQKKVSAEKFFLEALRIYGKTPPPDKKLVMVAHTFLVELYSGWRKEEKATEHSLEIGKILGDVNIEGKQALYAVKPTYPSTSKEGYALFEFTVDNFGKVKDINTIDFSDSVFIANSISALEQWRFAPRVVDGIPVDTEGVKYQFIYRFPE